jgi:hypothetical protein
MVLLLCTLKEILYYVAIQFVTIVTDYNSNYVLAFLQLVTILFNLLLSL